MENPVKASQFFLNAQRFADRHPVGSQITPIDFYALDQEGIRTKSEGPGGTATYKINCSRYRQCAATLIVQTERQIPLTPETVLQIGWTGSCELIKLAVEAQRTILEPPNS